MSFIGDILNRRKSNHVPPNATFRLTQEGREKLTDFGGDPKSRILSALEQHGTSSITEISRTSGLSRGAVERMVPSMIHGGYIQYVNVQALQDEG
jgi:DNA-binding MarR family transcriptional regulator